MRDLTNYRTPEDGRAIETRRREELEAIKRLVSEALELLDEDGGSRADECGANREEQEW